MNCDECGLDVKNEATLMLPNDLWAQIANKKDLLCASCICKRVPSMVLFVHETRDIKRDEMVITMTTKKYNMPR